MTFLVVFLVLLSCLQQLRLEIVRNRLNTLDGRVGYLEMLRGTYRGGVFVYEKPRKPERRVRVRRWRGRAVDRRRRVRRESPEQVAERIRADVSAAEFM